MLTRHDATFTIVSYSFSKSSFIRESNLLTLKRHFVINLVLYLNFAILKRRLLNFFPDLEFNSTQQKSEKRTSLNSIKKEVSLRKLTLDQILDSSLHLVQRSSAQVSTDWDLKSSTIILS